MSSKRRSCRTQKAVNYSECGEVEHGSDDDFENDFAPPLKKNKVKCEGEKTSNKKLQNVKNSAKERLSLGEKLYQRDIEKALQLSLDSQPPSQEPKKQSIQEKRKLTQSEVEGDNDYDPEQEAGYEGEEDYDSNEESNSDFSREESKIKKGASKTKRKEGADTNEMHLEKAKTDRTTKKDIALVKQPSRAKITEKRQPEKDISSSKRLNKHESDSASKKAPFPGKSSVTVMKNRSPTFGLAGVVIKNPGPPIRVGLSRNKKVKPLHAKVSVTQ